MRNKQRKYPPAPRRSRHSERFGTINPDETLLPVYPDIEFTHLYHELDSALAHFRQYSDNEYIYGTVISGAYAIARHHLPPEASSKLNIPDGRIHKHLDEGYPTLQAIFILLRSYDATGNDHLRAIIEYMLDTADTSFVEALRVAYVEALASEPPQPIYETFMQRSITLDNENDSYVTLTPDSGAISLVPDTAEMAVMA